MFIPEHSAQQVQAAHNYRLAKSGLPPCEIIATDAQLDQSTKNFRSYRHKLPTVKGW